MSLATDVKRTLGKRGKSAADIAAKLGRTGKGLGPVLRSLTTAGAAVRNKDGTYSKS
jgi:hypothetical protein